MRFHQSTRAYQVFGVEAIKKVNSKANLNRQIEAGNNKGNPRVIADILYSI